MLLCFWRCKCSPCTRVSSGQINSFEYNFAWWSPILIKFGKTVEPNERRQNQNFRFLGQPPSEIRIIEPRLKWLFYPGRTRFKLIYFRPCCTQKQNWDTKRKRSECSIWTRLLVIVIFSKNVCICNLVTW